MAPCHRQAKCASAGPGCHLLDATEESGQLDNTLVIFIQGYNGASPEWGMQGTTNEVETAGNGVQESLDYLLAMIDELGGPLTYNHCPGLSWPKGIHDNGGIRSQFCHVIDILATVYEAIGIEPPRELDGIEQNPLDGTSFLDTFDDAQATERHTTEYFEMCGNRAIHKEAWMASTTFLRLPWITTGDEPSPDDFQWELCHVVEDFSQARNQAGEHPEKLEKLIRAFDEEALARAMMATDRWERFGPLGPQRDWAVVRPALPRDPPPLPAGSPARRLPGGGASSAGRAEPAGSGGRGAGLLPNLRVPRLNESGAVPQPSRHQPCRCDPRSRTPPAQPGAGQRRGVWMAERPGWPGLPGTEAGGLAAGSVAAGL